MVSSRIVPVDRRIAFEQTLALPLNRVFRRGYGPIPPIEGVSDVTGGWASPGDSRTIRQADGATLREELVTVEEPLGFTYRLGGTTGPLALLTGRIDGAWSFTPVPDGTDIRWAWHIHPRAGLAVPALYGFRRLWSGYAERALESLAGELTDGHPN